MFAVPAIAHRIALTATVAVLLTACSAAAEETTSPPPPTGQTGPVDASQLTQNEYLTVGTWEIASISDPESVRLGEELGDTCAFASDFSLECTIAGERFAGQWAATDSIEVGDLATVSTLYWMLRGETNASSGSAKIGVDETEMVLGGGGAIWTLIERLPRQQPQGKWMDQATQQLMGSWDLITGDEERTMIKLATAGDLCTFAPDHTFVCDGENARTAIWDTARSIFGGTTLTIIASPNVRISGDFEISGDVLKWDIADAVFQRSE